MSIASNASGENMDQRELERQDREKWRLLDRLTEAVEDLAQHGKAHRELARLVAELLEVLGDTERGLVQRLHRMPGTVSDAVADKLNTDALDLIRHVRYWLGEIQKAAPGIQPGELPPAPPPGSGGWMVKPAAREEHTGVFDLAHTDGTRKKALELLGEVVWWGLKRGWPFLLAAGTAAVTHFAHHVQHVP